MGNHARVRHVTEDAIIDRLRRDELRALVVSWLRVRLVQRMLTSPIRDLARTLPREGDVSGQT